MRIIGPLRNPIQNYAWGSHTAIRGLFGESGAATLPEAELWLGAHPKAPSEVEVGGTWHRLDHWLAADPASVLGAQAAARFGKQLPFLFKVLAAAEPLSIQAHPNAEEARKGFDDEERRGIARDAPDRTYRDPNAKPELIYALTPFWMVRGLRPVADIIRQLQRTGLVERWSPAAALARAGQPGLARFLGAWLGLSGPEAGVLVESAVSTVLEVAADADCGAADTWLGRLAETNPTDAGALAPLVLETFALAPGEAVFTGPGVLHAYLDGLGLEVMASSDNVLRGGLTGKHVDVEALLGILDLSGSGRGMATPDDVEPAVTRFAPPAAGFSLTALDLDARTCDVVIDPGVVAIVLVTSGEGQIEGLSETSAGRAFASGDSFLVAGCGGLRLRGSGRVFVAGC